MIKRFTKLMVKIVMRHVRLIRNVVAKPGFEFPFQQKFWWTAAEQKRCNLISSVGT